MSIPQPAPASSKKKGEEEDFGPTMSMTVSKQQRVKEEKALKVNLPFYYFCHPNTKVAYHGLPSLLFTSRCILSLIVNFQILWILREETYTLYDLDKEYTFFSVL